MKKVDLSNIKHITQKNGRKIYLWDESNGAKLPFVYDDIVGEIIFKHRIPDCKEKAIIEYEEKEFILYASSLTKSAIGNLFEKEPNWKYEIGEILHERKWNIKFTNREIHKNPTRRNKFYQFYCYDCGFNCKEYDYWINEDTLSNHDTGCPCCSNKFCAKGINDIATTAPWMMEYMADKNDACKYTSCSGEKIDWKCPICNRIKNLKISRVKYYGIGCTYCSDGISYGEKFMRNLFDSLDIEYTYQLGKKDFEWCNKYRYDFYLPKYNYIIEVMGEQHYKLLHGSCFGNLKDIQKNDEDKYNLAKDKITKYITIDTSNIEENYIVDSIKSSELNNIINWNKVDVKNIAAKSHRNIFMDVCKYYSENYPNVSTSQMADLFHLNIRTISHYLAIGDEYELCVYDANKSKSFINANRTRVPLKVVIGNNTYAFDCRARLRELRGELFNGLICDKTIYKYADTNKPFQDKYYIYNMTKEEFNNYYDNQNDTVSAYGDRFVLDIL